MCYGCVIHFVNIFICLSICSMELNVTTPCPANIPYEHNINKNELSKTVRLIFSFQTHNKLQSIFYIFIFFKFIHLCLLLYFPCYLYLLCCLRGYVMFPNLVSVPNNCLNFDTCKDTSASFITL